MRKLTLLFLLSFLIVAFFGCSTEKRIAKAVKKFGAKQMAAHIAIEYPEYFKRDTIFIHDTITVKVPFVMERIVHDTIIQNVYTNDCNTFDYSDKDISFHVRNNTRVWYDINEKNFEKIVQVPYTKVIPSPPCPQLAIMDQVKKEYEEKVKALEPTSFDHFKTWFFWIVIAAAGVRIAIKIFLKK